jgi:hypothetical protein
LPKAQAWSIDLIIAVVIFILVITIFYTLLVREPKTDVKSLQKEARTIANKISDPNSDSPCSFLNGKDIDANKMKECFNTTPYKTFKEQNNLENKFCIFMVDQNGRVITVDGKMGYGYPELNVSGTMCGKDA